MKVKQNLYQDPISIKFWADDDKPREKLLMKGKSAMSNSELLAIIIGSGNKEYSALALAKIIMDSCNQNLAGLSKMGIDQLKKFKGIGKVKAITIEAALELGKRRQETEAVEKEIIASSQIAYEHVRSHLQDLNHEEFWVMYLNRANKKIALEHLSKGGITGTVADSRLIFKKALELKATGIILFHNHPSGSNKPSTQDIDLTKKMKTAGQTLDISVLDHLILAEDKYFSFADEGIL